MWDQACLVSTKLQGVLYRIEKGAAEAIRFNHDSGASHRDGRLAGAGLTDNEIIFAQERID